MFDSFGSIDCQSLGCWLHYSDDSNSVPSIDFLSMESVVKGRTVRRFTSATIDVSIPRGVQQWCIFWKNTDLWLKGSCLQFWAKRMGRTGEYRVNLLYRKRGLYSCVQVKGMVLMQSCQIGFQKLREINSASILNVIFSIKLSVYLLFRFLWFLGENSVCSREQISHFE